MVIVLFVFFLFFSFGLSAEEVLLKKQISFSAVVASTGCSANISSDEEVSNEINFGVYDKSSNIEVVEQNFSIKFYNLGSGALGCNAFNSTNLIRVTFGDEVTDQLDNFGVVTQGNSVRIQIRAIDQQASTSETITSENNVISYPGQFSALGKFEFNAKATGLNDAKLGVYQASLSITITYE